MCMISVKLGRKNESYFVPGHRTVNMPACCFMLCFLLLLSERSTYCGSTISPEMSDEELSGIGLPSSTITAITGTSTAISLLATSDQDVEAAITVTEIEKSEATNSAHTEESDMDPALLFGVPAALLLVLSVLLIAFLIKRRKRKQTKQEELGSENCKSPIFEEDTPSVMEIEMEELDKWMNSLKRNAECEYLPPLKEEKDGNANPSDYES